MPELFADGKEFRKGSPNLRGGEAERRGRLLLTEDRLGEIY